MSDSVMITIDMDKRCAECRKPGASGSGICIRCVAKAIDPKRKMRSAEGQSVQRRIAEQWAKAKGAA